MFVVGDVFVVVFIVSEYTLVPVLVPVGVSAVVIVVVVAVAVALSLIHI